MSLHVFKASDEPSSSTSGCALRLLCSYESGSVTLRRYARADKATSVEGTGWETIWDVKVHVETGVCPILCPILCRITQYFHSHGHACVQKQ